jgi:hypothetical protein
MMNITTKGLRSVLVGALAFGLAATACGNEETTTEAAESPLSEFLGTDVFGGFGEFDEAAFVEQQRVEEEKIAECMAEQGFEYIPVDRSQYSSFINDSVEQFGTREYAETRGFGVTTERFSQSEVGPDLIGYDDSFLNATDDEDGFSDPNQEIVAAMDPGTQQAYYEALYGAEDDFPAYDETMSDEELAELDEDFMWEPSGCQGEAFAEDTNNAFFQQFSDELDEMYEAALEDTRILDAEKEVSDCVAEKGFEYGGGFDEDVYLIWEDDLNAIEEMIGGFPGDDLTEEDFASMSEDELDALFNQPREFTDEARSRLAEIQAEEIELAVTVHDCGGGFNDQIELFQEVVADYEQRFIDDNADRLAEFKADS